MRLLILALFLCGCTFTVAPLPTKPKHYVHSTPKHTRTVTKAATVTVDSDWLANYKRMEKENHYAIPGDSKIEAVDGNFRVPQSVKEHYGDMLKASPSP